MLTPFYRITEMATKLEEMPIDDMGRKLSSDLIIENQYLKPYRLALMDAVVYALEKQGISFWVSDGTCLGTYRSSKMIPHDCDIDLMVHSDDMDKLDVDGYFPVWVGFRDQRDNRNRRKVVFYNCNAPRECKFQDAHQQTSAELDLYTMIPGETPGTFRKQDDRFPQSWNENDIYPLKKDSFENRVVPVPNNMKSYLESVYGYIGEHAVWDESIRRYRPLYGEV